MGNPFQESSLNQSPMQLTNRFGIYVHIPFCVHKCSYCDFYSFTKYSESDFSPFIEALSKEIRSGAEWLRLHHPGVQPAKSIFFGGGTPSLLPATELAKIFEVLKGEFSWDSEIEITIEANPETVSRSLLEKWKRHTPINRVSMGAQSFQSRHLKTLERLGSSERIKESADILKEFGFSNFNLDLIVGIPGQTLSEIVQDIKEACSTGAVHLSNYNLTLKPGHTLFQELPDGDISADLYECARKSLEDAGYRQYEISNYAMPGFECAHNLLYWSGGDFFGVGPSASSRFFWEGVFHHRKQVSDHVSYLKQDEFVQVSFQLTTLKQTQLEALFLELRRNSGIEISKFLDKYGVDLTKSPKLELLIKEGLLELKEPTLRLTSKGRLLADSVVCELL